MQEHTYTSQNQVLPVGDTQLTMSSREIAELCGKGHRNVLRDIRAYAGAVLQIERGLDVKSLDWNGKEGVELFEHTPVAGVTVKYETNAQNGEKYPIYYLDKATTLTVVSGYNVLLRKRIIDRWMELEDQVRNPANMLMARLNDNNFLRSTLLTYTEKVMVLEGQVAELSPKAEALDRIATADGSICVTDAAKNLQVRPKDLFTYLRSHGWIYKRVGTAHDVAYQSKLTAGLLEHKVDTVYRSDGSEKITTQVRVTPKGLAILAKLFLPVATAA